MNGLPFEPTEDQKDYLFRVFHEESWDGKPVYSREDFMRRLDTTLWTQDESFDLADGYELWDADDLIDVTATRYDDGLIEFNAGE